MRDVTRRDTEQSGDRPVLMCSVAVSGLHETQETRSNGSASAATHNHVCADMRVQRDILGK